MINVIADGGFAAHVRKHGTFLLAKGVQKDD